MATPLQEQPFGAPATRPVSEWKLAGNCLERPLRGAELLVRASEHYCDGNFNLTAKATISSTLTDAQLLRRHHAAWYRTRLVHPVIGVDFPTLTAASYPLHRTAKQAKGWTSRTCCIESKTTVNDVYLDRSREKMGDISLTLVLDPARGPRGCVLNIAHTLMNVDLFLIVQEYIHQLADPENERGVEGIFDSSLETVQGIRPRLPQSLTNAYTHLIPQPTTKDFQTALHAYQRSQDRWARPSIGIPLHPNHANRRRHIHNKTISFEPHESETAFRFLRKSRISLTAAFFACMVSTIATRYPPTPAERAEGAGAHLCFPVHGRRWLDTNANAETGTGPVRMPIIPCSAWLDASEVDLAPSTQKGLTTLAAAISKAMNNEVSSPHIIAVFEQLAPQMAAAMAAAHTSPDDPPPPPPRGRPTLTSQGQYSNSRDRDLIAQEGEVTLADFNSGGRTTDPSVCFALNSFRDELRFNLLFDEKFFDATETVLLGFQVAGLFRRLVGVELEQVSGFISPLQA
ncbi:hypothetical protein BDW74DRAFT_186028 [Aspergillus multicolor]|uniref:uncharacterized protein n=1 Tax=Aspergillus multicolor TaxID=41759 RepID=UPI003CCE41D0